MRLKQCNVITGRLKRKLKKNIFKEEEDLICNCTLKALLAMRRWDELAKDPAIPTPTNDKYTTMAQSIVCKKNAPS